MTHTHAKGQGQRQSVQKTRVETRGGSRKKYWGLAPVIWEATTAKRNLL